MGIDIRVAPQEFIVGTQKEGNLCYLTYKIKGKMNSAISWRSWSNNWENPETFKNEWASGFKLAGNNKRGWGRTINHDHILIEHPLCGKTFELSVDNFLELAFKYTIKNGEIMAGLLVNNRRELIDRARYSELLLEAYEKDEAIRKRKTKLKVKAKDLVPGELYICANTGSELFYLGTIDITPKNGKTFSKFCYTSFREKKLKAHTAKHCLFYNSTDYRTDTTHRKGWPADYCTKSRKPVAVASRHINIFDHLDESDWELFINTHEAIHTKDRRLNTYWLKENDNPGRGYHYQHYMNETSKFSEIKTNFRQEYLQYKQNTV